MTERLRFVATCAVGVEGPLADEMRAVGVEVRETRAAVTFEGSLRDGLRACLWSRLASRVLLVLEEFQAVTADDLYAGVSAVPWEDHISPDGSMAVRAVGTSSALTHTGFTAQKVKDAVVDRLRERTGRRPSVDLDTPDVRLNVRLRSGRVAVSLDLSGEPLHRRGYRAAGEQVEAPLKENLAAALLVRAGWPELAAEGAPLLDPMCGSGTLLVEGAQIATDRAPGLLRSRWGFDAWLGNDPGAWADLLEEADERAEAARHASPLIAGRDADPGAVDVARGCLERAGLSHAVGLEVGDVSGAAPPEGSGPGLVLTNPPHGLRLGATEDLVAVYAGLGQRLREAFGGWRAGVYTSDPSLAKATRLYADKTYSLPSGAVKAKLYLFDIRGG